MNKKKQFSIINWPLVYIVRLGVLLISMSVLSIVFIDQRLTVYLSKTIGSNYDYVANLVTWFGQGDLYFWIGTLGFLTVYITEKYFFHRIPLEKIKRVKSNFKFMLYSFLLSGVLLLFLKMFFGRCRPYNSPGFNALNFKPFTLDWNYQSYPSGHTQVSFTMACFLAYLWPQYTKWYFLLASMIAISRIVLDYHFLGDTLAGAYIGILGFYLSYKLYFKKPIIDKN